VAAETVERLEADVQKQLDAERDFSKSRLAKLAQLAACRPGTGEPTPEAQQKVLARTEKLRSDVASLEAAIAAARTARQISIAEVRNAEASELREVAERLRAEAGERQPQTDELLAQLREHEGVDYVPGPKPEYIGVPLARALTYDFDGATTTTAAMLESASKEEARALKLESEPVPTSGTASGATVDELAARVWEDAFRVGPTWAEIAAWYERASVAPRQAWEQERLHRHLSIDAWDRLPLQCTIVWRGGSIVEGKSTVAVPREANGRPPHPDNPPRVTGVSSPGLRDRTVS
jgi:hypothetical protein